MTTTNPAVRRQLSLRSAGSNAFSLVGIGLAVAGTIWVLLRLYVVVIPVVIAVLLAATPLALELVAGSILSLVLTFFFLKDGAALAERIPMESGRLENIWRAVSGYARALVVNATVNAIVIGVALALLGVPLALPIAVVTFAMDKEDVR